MHWSGIQNTYLLLLLLNTLAASFIWGINTLFLLDAGLTNTQAFAANAFFTLGQVMFEVPTGIVADMWGRRTSYLLGALTLAISTLVYLWAWQTSAAFGWWAGSSILLGLGFTFFSGATEAWLVDALQFTKFQESLESVFAKGQVVSGAAMLIGSVSGGLIAQATNLGVPYVLRAVVLGLTFGLAWFLMHDLGFTPKKSRHPLRDITKTFVTSVEAGWQNPAIRWVMLAGPFSTGVSYYAFYAMQPYLLELYGDSQAYGVAGLAAAIVAGAQIIGGLSIGYIRRMFRLRTSVLLAGMLISSVLLGLLGLITNFWVAIGLLVLWGLLFAATMPVRQAYLNGLIATEHRATVLSFDSLIGSSGGVVFQPTLGKVADVGSYPLSYVASAGIQILALPFLVLARRTRAKSDAMEIE